MSKAKVKIKVTPKKTTGSTLVAKVPVAIVANQHPSGQKLYQTKAQLNTHIYRGQRPKTTRLRRAN